jgi:hypothetical protein
MFTLSLLRDAGYRPLNCLCLLAWLALHWYARAGPICMRGHVNLMGYGEFDNDNRPLERLADIRAVAGTPFCF